MPPRPIVGLTCDIEDLAPPAIVSRRHRLASGYAEAVIRAGGLPLMLVPDATLAEEYVQRCDAIILTGGNDIDVRQYGIGLHKDATVMHPARQAFESTLMNAIDTRKSLPVLGICLGMQWMGVHRAGARALNQHLPDSLSTAAEHTADNKHLVRPERDWNHSVLKELTCAEQRVASYHHQAIADPGPMRVISTSPDGVIEAIDDPTRPFYVGVQWHPERTGLTPLGQGVFDAIIRAAGRR